MRVHWTYAADLQEILFIQLQMVNVFNTQCPCIYILLVVHRRLLRLSVMTTSVSLVVQDIMTTLHSIPITCGMVSSVHGAIKGGCSCRALGLKYLYGLP